MRCHRALLVLIALLVGIFCSLSGCGSGNPETAPVRGRITVGGAPVTQGRIAFYPEQGRMAQGAIGADGRYELTTFEPEDGALPGSHRVVITATRFTGAQQPQTLDEELARGGGGGTPSGRLEWLVPEIYSQRESTTLVADVKTGENEIDFNIPASN